MPPPQTGQKGSAGLWQCLKILLKCFTARISASLLSYPVSQSLTPPIRSLSLPLSGPIWCAVGRPRVASIYMTSAKCSDCLTPPLTVTNQLILYFSSDFWGPPPHTLRTSYRGDPKGLSNLREKDRKKRDRQKREMEMEEGRCNRREEMHRANTKRVREILCQRRKSNKVQRT